MYKLPIGDQNIELKLYTV